MLCVEPKAGLEPMILRSRPLLKSRLSYPGTPILKIYIHVKQEHSVCYMVRAQQTSTCIISLFLPYKRGNILVRNSQGYNEN